MTAWFKPHRYGFGAAPASWQGWLLVGVNIAIILGTMALILPHQGPLTAARLAAWLVVVVAATAVIVWIAHRNTEGGWRWRWGGK